MSQQLSKIRPLYVNTDTDELLLKPEEARYLKNYRIAVNENDNISTGTGDGSAGEGMNFGAGTPLSSSVPAAPDLELPAGINRCINCFECQETGEIYWFNWNSNGDHGIYRLNGLTGRAEQVYRKALLNFSIDPKYTLNNRVFLKVVYDSDDAANRNVRAKYLLFTDGLNWHRYLDVGTAIATDSFNSDLYPYFKMRGPHADETELINLCVSPPFFCPQLDLVPFNATTDRGKNNNLANKSLQFAYQYIYQDGRSSVFSPYSANLYVGAGGCQELNAGSPRCVRLTLDAGGPMVEQIRIFFRNCGNDWYIYETIDKYEKCTENIPFYERAVSLDGYNEDSNTFTYLFCGDKECAIFSSEDAIRVQNDLPLKSFALTPVGDSLLAANNLYGYDNLDCNSLKNVTLQVVKPGDDVEGPPPCIPKKVKISAYITVRGGPIVNIENNVAFVEPGLNGIQYDGAMEQNFKNRTGFIGYMAGTPFATIGENYKMNADGTMEKMGILNWEDGNVRNAVKEIFKAGGFFVQRFDFTLDAGIYIFRVASQNSLISDVDYQRTSTYIYGQATVVQMSYIDLSFFGFADLVVKDIDYQVKELVIDARAGDVDTYKDMNKRVLDFRIPFCFGETRSKALVGYILDTADAGNRPIEMMQYIVDEGFPETIRSGWFTDHNGFYFTSVQRGGAQNANVVFWGSIECGYRDRNHYFLRTSWGKRPRGQWLFRQDIAWKTALGQGYKECNQVAVKGKVVDENGSGVAGVSVTITRGGSTITNAAGEFNLKVHQPNHRQDGGHTDQIIFASLGGCPVATAGDCTPLAPVPYIPPSVCICPNETVYPVDIEIKIKYLNGSAAGLKGGGRYGIAIVGRDESGRQGFANNVGYVDIPTFLETGAFTPVTVSWKATDDFLLPSWVKWLSFYRTKNLNHATFLQWVGDKIEYINARGEKLENADEAVRARIYITSLFDWNKQNNFSTTVGYQFVRGDVLRIYDNGDGDLFKVDGENAFMDFPILGTNFNETFTGTDVPDQTTDPRSFIVGYDKRLNTLKDHCSFWIEILRPHACEERELYFEICGSIPVINGKLQVTGGVLSTWDTYYQYRQIHPEGCAFKTFNHPFESPSISDFWGANCENLGRVTVTDAQAQQLWYGDDVIKSDDFVNEGRVNGLGTWREKNRKNFKGQDWGAIVAIHAERSIVCFVCQNDWFLTDYNMNYIRATPQGLVLANLENNLSDPHQKAGSTYGCEFEDNASIIFDDGIGIWADRKNNNIVMMDYRNATDLAAIDNKSYFTEKFRHVTQYNSLLPPERYLSDLIEITACKDPKNSEYVISFRPRRGHSDAVMDFINNERETKVPHQETFAYNLEQGKWTGWRAYTPEHYGVLRYSSTAKEMIAFVSGRPYFMNSGRSGLYNNFFGVQTDQVITGIFNFDPSKIKIFQSLAVESNAVDYFVDKIITNERNSFSYIPQAYWKRKEGVWYSELQRDMNSYPDPNKPVVSMLADGKRIFGTYALVRLVRNTNSREVYNELSNIWMRFSFSERSEK
ncbi:carboxypeptidase-like regulatory domain-containing protein [Chitinophaga sp. CC14]|uniref:carboxypeptidase-like regulatory domain-containing protein n=1 Tax=Chitinophaga sp. CC14 TaxID=3029199 RepID=UPI003B77F9BB